MSNNHQSSLRLPLKKKWFDMTKAGAKTEDYREINYYWFKRFFDLEEDTEWTDWLGLTADLKKSYHGHCSVEDCLSFHGVKFKKFHENVMTLGYPKSGDTERELILPHKGIEIRAGKQEWGAEPGKLYFVIMHGTINNHM